MEIERLPGVMSTVCAASVKKKASTDLAYERNENCHGSTPKINVWKVVENGTEAATKAMEVAMGDL